MSVSYGYLVKDLKTGLIDTDSYYPVSEYVARNTELVEGYVWVKVSVEIKEVEELT